MAGIPLFGFLLVAKAAASATAFAGKAIGQINVCYLGQDVIITLAQLGSLAIVVIHLEAFVLGA